jgi:hypothetical protein
VFPYFYTAKLPSCTKTILSATILLAAGNLLQAVNNHRLLTDYELKPKACGKITSTGEHQITTPAKMVSDPANDAALHSGLRKYPAVGFGKTLFMDSPPAGFSVNLGDKSG